MTDMSLKWCEWCKAMRQVEVRSFYNEFMKHQKIYCYVCKRLLEDCGEKQWKS